MGLQSASKSTLVERGVVTQVIVSLTTSDNARATNTLYSSLTSVLTDFCTNLLLYLEHSIIFDFSH